MVCSYNDCFAEVGETCWKELCTDGCGGGNCTLWLQENGNWYGQECEDDSLYSDVRIQDVLVETAEVGRAYEDTLGKVFSAACMGDPACQMGGDTLIGLFSGKVPDVPS